MINSGAGKSPKTETGMMPEEISKSAANPDGNGFSTSKFCLKGGAANKKGTEGKFPLCAFSI